MNWKKIGWTSLQTAVVLLLNACGIAIVMSLMIGSSLWELTEFEIDKYWSPLYEAAKEAGNLELAKQYLEFWSNDINLASSLIDSDTLFSEWSVPIKTGVIVGEIIGAIISVSLIKYLYSLKREDKRTDKIVNATKEVKNGKPKDYSKYI